MSRSLALLLAAFAPSAVDAANGGYLSFTGKDQMATTKMGKMDKSNTEVQKIMANGFTIMFWARFHDETSSTYNPTLQIGVTSDGNFMQPFGGLHGGWQFASGSPATVSTLADATIWHHYAISWNPTTGAREHYIDGAVMNSDVTNAGHAFMTTDDAFVLLGMNCYPNEVMDPDTYHDCNAGHRSNLDMDDAAIFGAILTPAEISEYFTADMSAMGASKDSDMVAFWNFNDYATAATSGEVPNLGTGGTNLDLLLGKTDKLAVFGTMYTGTGRGSTPIALNAPLIIPADDSSAWATPKTLSPSAPYLIFTPDASSMNSVTIPAAFGAASQTANCPTAGSYVATGSVIAIDKALGTPVAAPDSRLTQVGLEDNALAIQVWSLQPFGSATTKITKLPTSGTLYDLGADAGSSDRSVPVTSVPFALSSTVTPYVAYVPDADQYGSPLDDFEYTAESLVDATTFVSSTATVSITIEGDNDKPAVTSSSKALTEDQHAGGVLCSVSGSDAETGTPLELMITKMPTKGKLYQTADGTLTGARTEIPAIYNIFEVGNTIPQYMSEVKAVSSFWGGPPYAGYHPLTILGAPDCKAYGECPQDAAWVTDMSVYPDVGQRLLHPAGAAQPLVAYVTGVDTAAGTLDIEYHKMFDSSDVQCVIDPAGPGYAMADCTTDLSGFTMSPTTGRLMATVARNTVTNQDAGGWCPLNKGLAAGQMSGGGTFGAEFKYLNHEQADYYSVGLVPAYTEYIEVSVATAVYPVLVEVGMPRGMGHIVAVKVKDPSGQWIALYTGQALTDIQAFYSKTRTYYYWAPEACRTHFTTADLRIELDTTSETGIGDWNYIDYVRLYGSTTLQPAALPKGTTAVVYVPDLDANGADSLEYHASDCPGNLFRYSDVGVVDFSITAVNDAPVGGTSYLTLVTDAASQVALVYGDVDDSNLAIEITSVEDGVKVAASSSDSDFSSYPASLAANAANVYVSTTGSKGNHTITFTITDGAGLSGTGTIIVTTISRPPEDQTGMFIAIIAALGGIIVIIIIVVTYRALKFIRAAIKGKKLHEAAQRARVKKAVQSAVTMQSSCYLITFQTMKEMNGLEPHEVMRDSGKLKTIDDYESLVQLVNKSPIIFFSHQWVAWAHPDPDKIQYNEMVKSCEAICAEKGFSTDSVYIFLDYLSIPQKNVSMRLAAINTLGVFASICPYFIVVAPTTVHKDTHKPVNKDTYGRRGWCRLEQWGHMCLQGMENMFYYDGPNGKLKDIDDTPEDGGEDWFLDSIMVFGGDYTNPENKHEMVDCVLGLYSMVIKNKGGTTKSLYALIQKHHAAVFPEEYFAELPGLLFNMMDSDAQLKNFIATSTGKLDLTYTKMRSSKAK